MITTTTPEWDSTVQRLRMLVDTPIGKKFVERALQALTVEVDQDDLYQNCELVAATLANHLLEAPALFISSMTGHFPRLKNKAAIVEVLLQLIQFKETNKEATAEHPVGACPKCLHVPAQPTPFCQKCGIKQQLPTSMAEHSVPFDVIASLLATQNELLTKMQHPMYASMRDPDLYEEDDSIYNAKPTSIWVEKLLSAQECKKVIETNDYAMQTYLQRAMCLLVRVFQDLPPSTPKDILRNISTAVRDCEMASLKPGSKPGQAEKAALSTSLVGHRMTKEELKAALADRGKPPRYTPSAFGQAPAAAPPTTPNNPWKGPKAQPRAPLPPARTGPAQPQQPGPLPPVEGQG